MRPRCWLPRRSWRLDHNQCHSLLIFLCTRQSTVSIQAKPLPRFEQLANNNWQNLAAYVLSTTPFEIGGPLTFRQTTLTDSQSPCQLEFPSSRREMESYCPASSNAPH